MIEYTIRIINVCAHFTAAAPLAKILSLLILIYIYRILFLFIFILLLYSAFISICPKYTESSNNFTRVYFYNLNDNKHRKR